ncbi:helix-turn-helix domain-containing protein [Cupriavidus basilensis]|uniref:helix-turn-helix domain-containing protein n=1 Tax=Cupriavidus basilensis TaxID=68895 RepID=UPI0039F724F1
MDQRILFIADHLRRLESVSALCERYGISRKTGYKWIERYGSGGVAGLAERGRNRHCQERLPDGIRQAILSCASAPRRHALLPWLPAKIGPRIWARAMGHTSCLAPATRDSQLREGRYRRASTSW